MLLRRITAFAGESNDENKFKFNISLFLFFPLSGVRCCLQLFHRLIILHPPLSPVFFFQSPSAPVFFTSLLIPRLLLPCSRNYAALFGSLSSAILSTCPAHCNLLLTSLSVKLLCTPISSLNSTILRMSLLIIEGSLANFQELLAVIRHKIPKVPFICIILHGFPTIPK